ncbi:MAG: FAD-binding oxidoreductase [Desulfobacterales bacterium]|nr:FAD-binding oxidoreductase [Desulfobacterales bacterium]
MGTYIKRKLASDSSAVKNCIISKEPAMPPWTSEFYVNNLWFETSGLHEQKPNPPLLERKSRADIAIIGGGLTGLASAYHLAKAEPSKKIIIIEAGQCGYGASGRNGGFAAIYPLNHVQGIFESYGLEAAKEYATFSAQGIEIIRSMMKNDDLNCDLEETKSLELAEIPAHMKHFVKTKRIMDKIGIETKVHDRDFVKQTLSTNLFHGALESRTSSVLDPAKLCLGLKSIVESLNVEIYESTRITSVEPGKILKIYTEFGEIDADAVVIATNGYGAKTGLFKNGVFPLTNYVIATEPLSKEQMGSLGWEERHSLADTRVNFNYYRLSSDNRIVFGGEGSSYFFGNRLSSGNEKKLISALEKRLLKIWPQLEGVKITHRWGGTLGITLDHEPAFGVMGDHKNIYYGVGYSGDGVTWAQVAGKTISRLYTKQDTDLTRFFLTNTIPPRIPPEPFRKVGHTFYRRYLEFMNRF